MARMLTDVLRGQERGMYRGDSELVLLEDAP